MEMQREGCEPSSMSTEDCSRGRKIELHLKTRVMFTQEGIVGEITF